ncbi:FHA domain-containing protein [Sporosarcina limicola]|uniref:FHA domain-containing protein n=1 Tax=Sporosarcina limicola TaxID=34101 RepID=A0A927MMQ0_9BACL|nr:FHA domain-containing protein [Sporosarcina limicola]MBE1555952.1 hypothetical protein [Sporosarcina limicola]
MSETNKFFDNNSHEMKGNNNNQISIEVIDTLIIMIGLLALMYVFFINEIILLRVLVGLLLGVVAINYALIKYEFKGSVKEDIGSEIMKLILIKEDGEKIKEWLVQGETSLLVGKGSSDREVDIDLSDTEYESLINNEHAVLNCVSGVWYIEDIDSINGTGVKKSERRVKSKLRHESPYRINTGDILYIANTRILVK